MPVSTTAEAYRADVDGLRAVAVLAVMIFHAHAAALPGGFIGVDIFFVISGYLISKHIAADVAEQRFSLAEFYRRRIRRIMPMMLVVVAATLPTALLLMTPEDARSVAKSALWSVASMANLHFWRELDTGYFAASSAEVPLLHLWSLGVEEQYYLLWPLLLTLMVRRLKATVLLLLMALGAGLSFAWASYAFPRDASFAYYMLPTRMGELLVGSVLGVAMAITRRRPGPRLAVGLAWLGAALVAASLWAIDRSVAFPGWWALPPTLGAAMLILAGEQGRQPLPGLTSPLLVFIGKISYSAYLWHWPLFAFFRYGWGEPGWLAGVTIIALTLLLAALSFRMIEQPTRRSNRPLRSLALRQFIVPGITLIVVSLAVIYAPRIGLPLATDAYTQQLARVRETTRAAFTFDWVCQRQRLAAADLSDPKCVLGAPGDEAPRALLWGDSNAAHYVPMVSEFAARAGVRVRNAEVGACPPLFTDPRPYVDARRSADCVASAAVVQGQIDRYRVVLISAAWSSYVVRAPGFIDDVENLVRSLAARGQRVVLIGKAPVFAGFDPRCMEKALRLPFKSCPQEPVALADEVVQVNALLRGLAERVVGVSYFDANRYLCPDGRCGRQTAAGQPRYLDASHLTVNASKELGQVVLAGEGLPKALSVLLP